MTCTYDHLDGCRDGYDYGYKYQAPSCCNAGMSTFWAIMLWISLGLCICLCCSMLAASMRRRRMQMMMAQQRNQRAMGNPNEHRMRANSDISSEEASMLHEPPRNNNYNRPVYNAPIGGSGPVYAPPAMAAAPLSIGVRPEVDQTKGTT